MKKNLFAILALPALVAVSCSNEEPISLEASSEGNVTFVAQLPGGINSRSFADGTTATCLWLTRKISFRTIMTDL